MPDKNSNSPNIWAIYSGKNGYQWKNLFKKKGLVAVQTSDNPDNNTFFDHIDLFIKEIKKGDTILAIYESSILGIGTVISDYISPEHKDNPVAVGNLYRHIYRVKWAVDRELKVVREDEMLLFRPFCQDGTVRKINCEDYKTITDQYLKVGIDLNSFKELKTEPVFSMIFEELPALAKIINNKFSKNIILYGSPGTGKTYTVNKFTEVFLVNQLRSPLTSEQIYQEVIPQLKWHEAVALSMYIIDSETKLFKVPEISKNKLMDAYWRSTKTQNLSSMIHAMLQIHTDPKVKTVKYAITKRQSPYLFERDIDSYWFLTDVGKEYVEEILEDRLYKIQNPNEVTKHISQYLEFVTFHQSFAYEEFLEGIKPGMSDPEAESGEVTYKIRDGIFKQICNRAKADPENNYLIIIDEINRANISKVFGELITLIEDDKRLGAKNELKVKLPCSQEMFGVPSNLYIIGTMNTSDRSIALLDVALRRRFAFIELKPRPDLLEDILVEDFEEIELDCILTNLNENICKTLDQDYQIGHSYFMDIENLEDLRFVWYYRIMPLLQEHFYHDRDRLEEVIGEDLIDTDSDLDDEDFKNALLKLSGAGGE